MTRIFQNIVVKFKSLNLKIKVVVLLFVLILFAGKITVLPIAANTSQQNAAQENRTPETISNSDTFDQNSRNTRFPKEYYSSAELHIQIIYYIFIGGMALMIFYMFGIYFMYKDKLFLLYVMYMLSLLLYLGLKSSYFSWYVNMIAPKFHSVFGELIQILLHIFYLQFAAIFLNAKTDFPKLAIAIRYVIRILMGIMLVQLVMLLTPGLMLYEVYLMQFVRYFVIIFSLVAYVHIIKNYKDKIILFLLIGSFFYMIGALAAMFMHYVGYMMLGAAIEVFVFSLGMGYRVKQIEESKKSIENEIVRVQLTALKAQMNPHFIFNSLNSIRAYIISNNTKQASDYLTKFSSLIRLILQYSSQNSITLKDELDALALYVNLEQLRFREDFGYELKVDSNIDIDLLKVPPLILQPYVENAIRHGLTPKKGEKKLELSIVKKNTQIEFRIKDNGVGRQHSKRIQNEEKKGHISMAMDLTQKRIELADHSNVNSQNIIVVDLMEDGKQAGTEVILRLPENKTHKS